MRKARNAACFFLAALLPHNGLSASSPQPSAEEIMRKAVASAEKASEKPALPAYSFTKAAVSEELDSDGKVTARKQKVYHVWFKDGATHAKLVEVNGHPPAEADLKKTAENELNLRQMLGGDKSAPKDA